MILKISSVTLLALLSLSPPQSPSDEIAALRRDIQALKTQQAQMQRDLDAIKSLLQGLTQPRGAGSGGDPFVNKQITITNEPSKGSATAKLTIVEVSDYHCPFCRRQMLQTMPHVLADYVNTGKVQYVFVDYPIAQLHPDAFKSHEAAACAGDQGKYWQMHDLLFTNSPAREASQLATQASMLGLDMKKFDACMNNGNGGAHAADIRASIARMQELGVGGTPLVLIGLTPAPGSPMKVIASVYGAQPYAEFKRAIDAALAKAN